MIYNPGKLFFPVLAFVICVSLGVKSLRAMNDEGSKNPSPRIREVSEHIVGWEKSGKDVGAIKDYIDDIRKILSCPVCNGSDRPKEKLPYHSSLKKDEGKESSAKGYSGADIIPFSEEDRHEKIIKKFEKVEDGLKDLVYSLMAFHRFGDELKMVSICDAVICNNPTALSFVMEKAQGADIHDFMKTVADADTENVIKACARYLGTFHVGHLNQAKVEEGKATKFLAYVAEEFYHKLSKKRTQSLRGKKGSELFNLEVGKQIESININVNIKSDEIIKTLEEEKDQKTCIKYIGRTQKLFEKCSGYVYRALSPCGEGTKRLYWTTITHGDAHRRNFFYDGNKTLDLKPDCLERVTMIDYSSIMETWGNIGDPAQDVGRFLGSLWDWASEVEDQKNQEGLYSVIHGLQKNFLDCYIETVKELENISDDFKNIFIENCNFYKLRYYRTIFNSSAERKDLPSKMRLLQYWMQEMKLHKKDPDAAFANSLLKEKKYVRERQNREWKDPIEQTEQIIHNLPEKLTVFIESTPESSPDSHLTRLWKELNDSGTATLLQERDDVPIADTVGIGKTSLALEYAHESLKNRAYHLIWWLPSEEPLSLKQGYEDIMVRVGAFSESSRVQVDLKQLYEDIFVKTKEPSKTSSNREQENQKNGENSVKRLKTRIEKHVENQRLKNNKYKWLLIYDNAEDLRTLKGLIPQHKNIHILVTSHNKDGCENPFLLNVFTLEESVKYLLAETGVDTENPDYKNAQIVAQEVAKTLGYLPLALSEAANYIKLIGGEAANSTHFRKYLENPGFLTNPFTDPENRCKRFVDTLYEELSKDSKVSQHAIDIMVLCAYLNPDLISEKFFWGTALDQGKTKKVLKKLYDTSYLSVKEGGVSIHCLAQKYTLSKLGTNEKLLEVSRKIETLFHKYVSEESDILDILTFFPHVFKLLEHANPLKRSESSEEKKYKELNESKEINSLRWIGKILCNWYNHPDQYAYELLGKKQTGEFERILSQAEVNGKQRLLKNRKVDMDPKSCMNAGNLYPKIYNTLGLIYAEGKYGLEKNPTQGMKYLQESNGKEDINAKSKEKGDINTPFYMGRIHEMNGDYTEAEKCYNEAVNRKNFLAMISIGKLYENGSVTVKAEKSTEGFEQAGDKCADNPQYKKAIECYTKASECENNVTVTHLAMISIGKLYENKKKNFQTAMKWYKKAKSSTDLVNLGKLHQKPETQRYKKAMECYEAAEELGDSTAMAKIGWLYENGLGVKQDYAEARKKYEEAAGDGNSFAITRLGKFYENRWGGLPQDYAEARKKYEKAAGDGNSYAINYLGKLYENGWGVDKNYDQALELYKKAAELGDAYAISCIRELGNLYKNGRGIQRNTLKANECFKVAKFYENKGKK